MGLQSAAEGYLTLASHISKVAPYELPQVIAQIPPPPMDLPMAIRKALLVDGESKAVNYLICGEYELNKTLWSNLQKKYNISRNKVYAALKGKEDLEVPNINKGENKWLNQRQQHQPPILKL